jgi:endonuclease-3
MNKTAEKVIEVLNKIYKIKITREEPFKVLIAVMLSHRTKDGVSFPAAERLLSKANTAEKINKLPVKLIERIIYPVGFYRQKAKRIKQTCRLLIEKFDGKVPRTREDLMQLPGIGQKSASIVMAYGFGIPTIAVDTHVNRISQRLGWVPKNSEPEKTQPIIEKLIPKQHHLTMNHLLITFGKDICRPRPQCYRCPVYDFCKYEKKEYYKNFLRASKKFKC